MFSYAADFILLLHACFILFVLFGALFSLRFRWSVILHLPAAAWGALSEWNGWICPLTPLENRLRLLAKETPYTGGFIDHYLLPLIYPEGLTRDIQYHLALIVIFLNLLFYGYSLYHVFEEGKLRNRSNKTNRP
jgi:hypothetical protein